MAVLVSLTGLTGLGANSGATTGTRLAAYISSATQVSDQVLEQVGLPGDLNPPRPLSGQPALNDRGAGSRLCRGGVLPVLCRHSLGARDRAVEVRHVLQPGPGRLVVVKRRLPGA